MASSQAVRRLCRDLKQLEKQCNQQLIVKPSNKSMLEWHFVLHNLPADTVYNGGCYHGKLLFPEQYPLSPPALIMLTPNGRLETGRRLCLSMTDFHPESWNPAWTIESILVGLISFMVDERDPHSYGVVNESPEARQAYARSSRAFNLADSEFCELFPEISDRTTGTCSDTRWHPGSTQGASGATVTALPMETDAVQAPGMANLQELEQFADAQPDSDNEAPPASALPTHELHVSDGNNSAAPAAEALPASPILACVQPVEGGGDRAAAVDQAAVGGGEEDTNDECWICREDGSQEPLVQLCACRGSMSGVHASCVEAWIKHHRINAVDSEVPHCSVCGEPYMGTERRPGVTRFAWHLCNDFIRQAIRSTVLVILMVAYWTAAQPDAVPLALRLALFLVSGGFFGYKAIVLMVSLPPGQLPPDDLRRHFFSGNCRWLAVHIAETVAIIVICGLWFAYGQIKYFYFLPVLLLAVLPLVSVLLRQQHSPCSYRTLALLGMILCSPVMMMMHIAEMVWRDPLRLADPSDGLVHLTVPLITIPLCWFCSSNVPVLILWAAHSVVLITAIIEKAAIRRMTWKEGRIWWILMQFSVLATYVANLLHNFHTDLMVNQSSLFLLCASMSWLMLICVLSLLVNGSFLMHQYRAWQHRNGSFTLSPRAPAPQTFGAATDAGVLPQRGQPHPNGEVHREEV